MTESPPNFASLVAEGDARLDAGDHRAASAYYTAALKQAEAGAPYDRPTAQRALRRLQDIEQGYVRHLHASLERQGFPQSEWHPRVAKSIAMMTGQIQREDTGEQYLRMPTTYFYPDLLYAEYYDTAGWSWVKGVEAHTEQIVSEAKALMDGGDTFAAYMKRVEDRPQGNSHGLLENDDWSTFDLIDSGKPIADRVGLCPYTYRAITDFAPQCRIPKRAPTIMFSLLKAGALIPPHTGMLNPRLICHLPLIVPGEGALRVGSSTRAWERGKLMVFDDTIEHEAWNRAQTDRLVLIFDIWHPDLEEIEQAQIAALFDAVDSY